MAWGDKEFIDRQLAAGRDLSQPVWVTHHLYLSEEARALECREVLSHEGFSVSVEWFPDRDPPEWEVVAGREDFVTLDTMTLVRSLMETLSDDYDGWTIGKPDEWARR